MKKALAKKADKTIVKTLAYVLGLTLKIALVIALMGYVGIETSSFAAIFASLSVCVGLANRRGFVREDMKNLPVEEKDDIAFLVMLAVARHGNQKLIVDAPNSCERLLKKFDEFIEMC